jgi:hypothetical protein
MSANSFEPCLCGDPECGRCFPRSPEEPVKPTVQLTGADSNVFNIIGLCVRAARRAGWSVERVGKLRAELFAADDYDHVLRIAMEHLEVE